MNSFFVLKSFLLLKASSLFSLRFIRISKIRRQVGIVFILTTNPFFSRLKFEPRAKKKLNSLYFDWWIRGVWIRWS